MDKIYQSKDCEAKWEQFWIEKEIFKADPSSTKPPFSIVIPPPNVTGKLHMGHALVNTLQDILIRFKKMCGYEVLWVPGTDHAGIATQTVVEQHLIKTQNKRKSDFSREEFLKIVWKWKEDHEHVILNQLKKIGCSLDWSRLAFTMDKERTTAVLDTFKKLYDDGLIYRDNYLVNWDTVTQTALSDDEVEHEEKQAKLYYIHYALDDDSTITIATTRPETLLADTAVAVSKKHAHLLSKMAILPITNRKIPIVVDDFVDPEFGTGMVKITPAHDFNDYELAKRHDLPMINMMTKDGKINENGVPFEGQTMLEARKNIIEELKKIGALEKIEEHVHRVGKSYRSKAIIEPYLSKQWFINMAPFKDKLIELVKSDTVELIPKEWKSTYFHWIENLRNWCISRQLWWGHRIPVYYNKKDPEKMICAGANIPKEISENPDEWIQDEDVLDTWFSSSLWPFSTLGYPEPTPDMRFFPNSVLITGHDILFFWVARMLWASEYLFKKPPFPKVFLHGLIFGKSYWRQDERGHISYLSSQEKKTYDMGTPVPKDVHSKWEKMSKSKGNVIDPIEIIKEFGVDSMRMALSSSACQNKQIDLDRRRFEEFKHFSNKIWNGARFSMQNLFDDNALIIDFELDFNALELEDFWILEKAKKASLTFKEALENFHYEVATNTAYTFFWNELCAYYLEIIKPVFFGKRGDAHLKKQKQCVLLYILTVSLRLLHPLAPFITEEIFSYLKKVPVKIQTKEPILSDLTSTLKKTSLALTQYPEMDYDFHSSLEQFDLLDQILYQVRNMRAELKILPGTKIDLLMVTKSFKECSIIETLGKTNPIQFVDTKPEIELAATSLVQSIQIIMPLPKELIKKEKERLRKERQKLEDELDNVKKRLSNKQFLQNAPKEIVDKLSSKKQELEAKLQHLRNLEN
ncbi:MAG: Valine--tRNA ligase [Chlamydiae bacterium]|nr:Valine--tRNA ligase [Chlamydiota bacterium]